MKISEETEKLIIKLIRDLAGALLAGLLFVLFLNRGVLLHKDNVNFVRTSPDYTATYELDDGYRKGIWTAYEGNSVTVVNRDGSVHSSFDAFETGLYVERLSFELENLGEKPLDLTVRVSCLENESSLKEYEYTDFQPIYLVNEVIPVRKEHVVAVDIYPTPASANADGVKTGGTDSAALSGGASVDEAASKAVFRVGAIRVDNRFIWNPYAFFFVFAAVFCLAVLVEFGGYFRKRPAAAFLLIALLMGLSMVTGLPRNKIGYDEESHLQAVVDMASFPSGELHLSDAMLYQLLITEYNHPDAQPANAPEMREWNARLSELANYREGARTPDFYTLPNRIPSYLVMAAAVKLGKGLHLSWPSLLLLARTANLLMYIAVMTLAIWFCPAGQWLMMLIGLFPINIFLACTVSYDPFIIAFLSLGYALMMRGRKYVLPALLCIFAGCLSKAVYAPIALLPLIWLHGRKEEDDTEAAGSREQHHTGLWHPDTRDWLLLFGCGLVFVLLAGTFILPTILVPAQGGDMRGGEAVSEVSQVGFILGHPFRYMWILLRQIILWFPKCWFGADCITHMGHIVNGSTAFKGYYPAYMILLAGTVIVSWIRQGGNHAEDGKGAGQRASETASGKPGSYAAGIQMENGSAGKVGFGTDRLFHGKNPERPGEILIDVAGLHLPARIWTILMVGAASVLIWTSMYVAFTEPGAPEIAGVQGRYFIPLMFPFYMVLSGPHAPKTASLETKTGLWYYLLELAGAALLALTVWTAVISRFCL